MTSEREKRLVDALREIRKRASDCWCDRGYPGGCGCGHSIGGMAIDALCLNPSEYGACGVCDECMRDQKGGE